MQKPGGWGCRIFCRKPTMAEPGLAPGTLVKSFVPILFCRAGLFTPVSGFSQSDDSAEKSRRAKEFMAEGKFTAAVPLYRELNLAVPNNPGLLLNLGMSLHMAGDESQSILPLK